MNDEQSIRALIQNWAEAVRQQDLDAIVAHHPADMLMFDVPPPVALRGLEAYRESWLPFFDSFRNGGVFEIAELRITASDSVAFAIALLRCVTGAPAGPVEPTLRLTVGLRKENGSWLIAHEHHSFPQ
jgi:uncharacterized protein (TIGR02246 family)